MGIARKVLGPKSKYDKSIPYTYLAKVTIVEGVDDLFSYYYSDTICGLVEHLSKKDILPREVELFGLYRKREIHLDKSICLDENSNWLLRPELCRILEEYYQVTKNEIYKGHFEKEECAFNDREREVDYPV